MKHTHFVALNSVAAKEYFNKENTNPINSYKPGYEYLLNKFPLIDPAESAYIKRVKLKVIETNMRLIAATFNYFHWVFEDMPKEPKGLNRVILAIDKRNGTQLVLARWNHAKTPIHGHLSGVMAEIVISGKMNVTEYEITDFINRKVTESFNLVISSDEMISIGDYKSDFKFGAHVHKLEAVDQCITLHLIPGHPQDGKLNTFTLK